MKPLNWETFKPMAAYLGLGLIVFLLLSPWVGLLAFMVTHVMWLGIASMILILLSLLAIHVFDEEFDKLGDCAFGLEKE
jgi:hypothetical protein